MLELRVKAGRRHVPLYDLPVRLGRVEAAREIGDTVEELIHFLDEIGGEADFEDDDPAGQCDEDCVNTGGALRFGPAGAGCCISDDDSEHDGREVTGAEDDVMFHGWSGPGCPIADPGGTDGADC